MNREFYNQLADTSISEKPFTEKTSLEILTSKDIEVLSLLNAAYEVRKKFAGKSVSIHILNNAQNGYCPEDCHYCAQSKTSKADIEEYPVKSDEEILAEAKNAYHKGAHRYCMVFAGRGPSQGRTEHLANLIRTIKSQYPVEVCVSAGLLNQEKAKILKNAGLDRLNHNLNTSERHYSKICTTHTYADRMETINSAQKSGLEVCSGVIAGMGEEAKDIIEMAETLRKVNASSIPVNFYMPIPGVNLGNNLHLTPEYCLRILCLFRFLNPKAEIRIAAGREIHLRNMEIMTLYAANSLFLDGYLNTKGAERSRTFQMIKDAGFTIESDHSLDDLLENEKKNSLNSPQNTPPNIEMKQHQDLHLQKTPKNITKNI